MPYEGPQVRESQGGGLTPVRMRMPVVHCQHAEKMLAFITQ
jgi:hypothetical protein